MSDRSGKPGWSINWLARIDQQGEDSRFSWVALVGSDRWGLEDRFGPVHSNSLSSWVCRPRSVAPIWSGRLVGWVRHGALEGFWSGGHSSTEGSYFQNRKWFLIERFPNTGNREINSAATVVLQVSVFVFNIKPRITITAIHIRNPTHLNTNTCIRNSLTFEWK